MSACAPDGAEDTGLLPGFDTLNLISGRAMSDHCRVYYLPPADAEAGEVGPPAVRARRRENTAGGGGWVDPLHAERAGEGAPQRAVHRRDSRPGERRLSPVLLLDRRYGREGAVRHARASQARCGGEGA